MTKTLGEEGSHGVSGDGRKDGCERKPTGYTEAMLPKQTEREGAGEKKAVGVPSAVTAVNQGVSGDGRKEGGGRKPIG